MKRNYTALLVAGICALSLHAEGAIRSVSMARQSAPWYTNNFGASAEDAFPSISPQTSGYATASEESDRFLGLASEDVDFLLAGRVRQEGQLFAHPLTLRKDTNDVYGFIRSKLNLDFRTQFGRRTYGKPAAQMNMRLTAFSLWDDPYRYTPVLSEKVHLSGNNFLKKAEIDSHDHKGVVPLLFLEEGWVKVNFDSFIEGISTPLSLQVGAFPFIVGRGVSLGNYFEGGVEASGYRREGDIGNAPQQPMGVLMSAGFHEGRGIVEAYYSPWKNRNRGPDWTREVVKARRLDRSGRDDISEIERGSNANTEIFAARLCYDCAIGSDDSRKLYVEPYAVYLNAPELKVELDADSSAKMGTVGFMGEFASGNWKVNWEFAGQYGKQTMHAIDRNQLVVDDAYYSQTATSYNGSSPIFSATSGRLDKKMGQPMKYQSHVFLGATAPDKDAPEYLPYRAYYVSDEMRHINANRSVAEQGAQIRATSPEKAGDQIAGEGYVSKKHTADTDTFVPVAGNDPSTLYSQYQFNTGIDYYDTIFGLLGSAPNGTLFNANLPFGGMRRFRDAYTVTNKAAMALVDVRYAIPEKRINLSWCAAYIGGDKYPFTTDETDKTTKAFMPLRDSHYVGRYVTSFALMYPRKAPRPMDMSDNDLYAHNNYKTLQNLKYVGMGTQWYPFKDGSLLLEANGLYYWEVTAPQKWNATATRTFPGNTATSDQGGKEDTIYKFLQDEELHFSGAATAERASNDLYGEVNIVVNWSPYKSLQFDFRAGWLIPGKLFDDILGCPNANTRRIDQHGEWHHEALGTSVVSGCQIRVTYKF